MDNISKIYNEKDINLALLKDSIKSLEDLLSKKKISEKKSYKNWINDFENIYNKKYVNLELYIISALIFFLGFVILLKIVHRDDKKTLKNDFNYESFIELQDKVKKKFRNINLFNFDYFPPIITLLESYELDDFFTIINDVSEFLFKLELQSEYYFDFFIQRIIPSVVRHGSGEYFTPPFLVKKMVEESYNFGERVLDPCCGSGNFIIEIIKKIISSDKNKTEKIKALNNIYGFDINPISIFITKINFLLLLRDFNEDIYYNLFTFDSLFQKPNIKHIKFDLIIGNPPWYTFRDIQSKDYQAKIKNLADELEIKPQPKNILNIEISSLFFYQAKNLYLKKNGKIFFVITKGVITGSHTSRFRNFKGFKNIKIWNFSKKIEKIFNIDFICLYAQKSEENIQHEIYEIPTFLFRLENDVNTLNYFELIGLSIERKYFLMPYAVEKKGNKIYTKKLILKEEKEKLLANFDSFYKKLFHKGADLNPRNLIFVKYKNVDDSLVEINPDERIFKRAKYPWNKKEFTEEIVEKDYIFKVYKSTELVKFYIYDYYNVFLPLSKTDLSLDVKNLSINARKFYDKINTLYLKYKKETTSHNSLMDNLNRWNKLINDRQLSNVKVVYNNSGSVLNSAVIRGNFLVTGDLCFYDTNNLEEAYYLSSILNSKLMTQQIRIKKSSRHIFKIPLETPIKRYDPENNNHLKLVELGILGEQIVKSSIKKLFQLYQEVPSKIKIQNFLRNTLDQVLIEIDIVLQKELSY